MAWDHVVAVCCAGGWYMYNDSRVAGPLPEGEVVSPGAYTLFFRRRESAPKDSGALSTQWLPLQFQGSYTAYTVYTLHKRSACYRVGNGLECWPRHARSP